MKNSKHESSQSPDWSLRRPFASGALLPETMEDDNALDAASGVCKRDACAPVTVILCLIIFLPFFVIAQSGGTFVIEKSVIAGGGGQVAGGTFALDGTIGQPIGGATSSGATFELGSGFWGGGLALAANVSVSGKVTTPDGRGLRNAVVSLTDPLGVKRSVTTSSFGNYSFDNVSTGQTYTMRVASKLFRFSSRQVPVGFDNLTGVDFVGQE